MLRSLICAAALFVAPPLVAAPRLVADLNQGQNIEAQTVWLNSGDSSSPVLYFAASDPAHGLELWRSDGTSAGTWAFVLDTDRRWVDAHTVCALRLDVFASERLAAASAASSPLTGSHLSG